MVNRLGRWLGRGTLAGAMVLSLVVALAAPANAATVTLVNDDMEASASLSNWQFWSTGSGLGQFDCCYPSHSGNVYAELISPMYDAGGWTEMSRTLTRAWSAGNSCSVSVWLASRDNATVNVEVIDPSTWTYMALKTVTVQTETRAVPIHYIQVTTPTFAPNPSPFLFRVSVLNQTGDFGRMVYVDDFTYTCSSIRG